MASGASSIDIPICDPDGRFFGPGGSVAATPAAVAAPQAAPLGAAVFSVLQFGAIVPPLAPWPGVHRALPGYRYQGGKLQGPAADSDYQGEAAAGLGRTALASQAELIEAVVDQELVHALRDRREVVVLFSGGVDSGFLATRLRSLGYRDALLLNYSFSHDDPESDLAEQIAKHLDMRFERVAASARPPDVLESPGTIFPQPFADHSVVPTSDFAHALASRLNRGAILLDGTGADGAFGLGKKVRSFQRMRHIPSFVLEGARHIYQNHLWRNTGTVEKALRILSRLGRMPFVAALIAQNPLAGNWYSAAAAPEVYESLSRWIEPLAGPSLAKQAVVADLALVCANVFAQKARPILLQAGCEIAYPFMAGRVVAVAKAAVDAWSLTEAKAALKHSLSKWLPPEMIYRPKSGFADPAGEMFFTERFLQHLRGTAESSSPLAGLIDTTHMTACCDLLMHRRRLPAQTLNTLWAITFTDRWYRTATPGRSAVKPDRVLA